MEWLVVDLALFWRQLGLGTKNFVLMYCNRNRSIPNGQLVLDNDLRYVARFFANQHKKKDMFYLRTFTVGAAWFCRNLTNSVAS